MLLKKGIILTKVDKSVNVADFKPGDIIYNSNIFPPMKIVRKNDNVDSHKEFTLVHLYLFVEEDASPGDYMLDRETDRMITSVKSFIEDIHRLVATTDKAIPSARLSKQFLNSFVDNSGSNDVKVVYVETQDKLVISKNKRNIIELGDTKEMYTGIEVVDKIMDLVSDVYDDALVNTVFEWCNENI